MKLQITYWTMGDSVVTRVVKVPDTASETVEAEINKLVDDEQAPLAQVKQIIFLDSTPEK